MAEIIFLDRDGVINKDPGGWTEHNYVTRREDVMFITGSLEAIKKLTDAGYDIILMSNQAGVSKGYFSEKELGEVNSAILEGIKRAGGKIRKVYYCIHQDSDDCDCRKPKTGLFKKAEKELSVIAAASYFIGDGKMDVEAGAKMKLRTVLLLSGKSSLEEVKSWSVKPDYIFDDLAEAVGFILKGAK